MVGAFVTLEIAKNLAAAMLHLEAGMYVGFQYTRIFASIGGAKRPTGRSEAGALMGTEAPLYLLSSHTLTSEDVRTLQLVSPPGGRGMPATS